MRLEIFEKQLFQKKKKQFRNEILGTRTKYLKLSTDSRHNEWLKQIHAGNKI